MTFFELIYNLSLLVALSVVSGFLSKKFPGISIKGKVVQGLLFGIVAIVGMLKPLIFSEGLIFDGRSVVLSIATLFFGPVSGAIAGTIALIFRIAIGGPGTLPGTLVIISSVIIGTIFYFLNRKANKELTVIRLFYFGLAVHIAMLLIMFSLPLPIAISVIQRIGIIIILIYPLATILIGKILSDQEVNARNFENIKANEEKYRYMFANNPQPMIIFDLETLAFLEINTAAIHQYGYTREEFLSMTITDLVSEEDMNALMEDIELSRHTNNPTGEWRHKKKNGEIINVEMICHSITFNDRKSRHVMINDITKRKQAEEALRKNEARLCTLVETIPDLVWLKDTEGVYLVCNPEFERFFEAKEADIIGKTDYDFVNKELADFFRKNDQTAMAAGKPTTNEEWITFANESQPILLETIKTPMYDDQNKLIGVLGIGRDITERKKAEETLRESERKSRTLIEDAVEIIFITDNQGYFTYVNPAGLKASGYTLDELKKLKYIDLIEPEFKQIVKKNYFRQYLQRAELTTTEYPYKTRNGKISWFNQNARLIIDNDIVKGFYIVARDVTDRRIVQEALKESEERFRSLYENSIIGIYRISPDGKIILANPTLVKLIGYSSFEEIASMNLEKVGFEPNHKRKQFLDQIEMNGEVNGFESAWICKDGSTKYISESAKTIRDSKGKTLYYDGIVEDITERKKNEETLLKLSIAVEQSPVSVIITNPEGNIDYVNKKFTELTGYTKEEILGKNPRILNSGFHDKNFYKEFWDTILSGKEWKGEMQNRKKNGDLYWQSALISPLVNDDGEITHFIAINEDITEQKKIKAELLVSEERYNAIFNTSLELIYIFDLQGRILEANAQALNLFGYTSTEAYSLSIFDLLSPDYFETAQKNIANVLVKGVNEGIQIYKLKKKTGEEFFVETTALRLDRDGKPYAIMGIARNITERMSKEKELIEAKETAEELNRIKSSFLANMSHELRTPLIGILGYAEFLQNELKDNELIEMANIIKTSGKRLNTTLNNILDISRIDSGKQQMNLKEQNLIKYLNEQVELFKVVAEGKGLSLNFETMEKILNAYIDEEMFVSIISNLLSNAIKFTKKGEIIVRAMQQKDKAVIEVEDTGIGVPEELQGIIFEPFRQASEGFSRIYEGTGLGLTIVKKYTGLMGGIITVESKNGELPAGKKQGSKFILELPVNKNIYENLIETYWT